MAKTKARDFDFDLFHDSTIVSIDFSNWLESISMTFFCPHGGGQWADSRFFRIDFVCVLFFGFEAQCIGEFGARPPFVSDVILEAETKELSVWKEWINKLATPSPDYPQGIKSVRYTNVYHFILDSVEFRGRAFMPEDAGFHIICRDFQVTDVTSQMPPEAPGFVPPLIESE